MDTTAQFGAPIGAQGDGSLIDTTVISELGAAIPIHRLLTFSDAIRFGCSEAISEFRAAAGSSGETAAIAHRVKGMVGNLGLRRLAEIAAALEQSGTWPLETRLSAVAEFEAQLEASLDAFQAEVRRKPTETQLTRTENTGRA